MFSCIFRHIYRELFRRLPTATIVGILELESYESFGSSCPLIQPYIQMPVTNCQSYSAQFLLPKYRSVLQSLSCSLGVLQGHDLPCQGSSTLVRSAYP